MRTLNTAALLFTLSAAGCTSGDDSKGSAEEGPVDAIGETLDPSDPATSCAEDEGLIVPTPSEYSSYAEWGFDRYLEVAAPNGKAIRIFAQEGVTDEQARRAHSVLRFFLTDKPDSEYGADKSAVANAMANNRATLMLPAGAHEPGDEPPFDAQPLFQDEMTLEGSDWYQNNEWDHRDATFEEIFHLVHDAGIGTWLPGALPEYQSELKAEAIAAIDDGRWGIEVEPGVADWIEELAEEDSLAQEYIASVIDSYYGYWGAFDEGPGGMWGVYIAKTRDEVASLDPEGAALLEAFLPSMVSYEARLDPDFEGVFSLEFDASEPYTHKSRYLLHATLTGSNPAGLTGNASDNRLRGNQADNVIDGGDGVDTVIYCNASDAYTVITSDGVATVTGPDGTDTLERVEVLHFSDGSLSIDP